MACLVAVLLGVVEFGMFMQLPLWIFPLLYVFWIMPNYFIEIVEHRALGKPDWPVFSQETLVAGRNQIGVIFSVLTLIGAGGILALRAAQQSEWASVLLFGGLAVLPASVALLAVTREFSAALNPLRWLVAAAGMGLGYLLCLLGEAVVAALAIFAARHDQVLLYPLAVYALFLLAWLIGSVVYARRRVLGVVAPTSPEARAERVRADTLRIRSGILNHAYGFAAHGNRVGALRHVEAYIASDEDTLEARLWMLNEMLRWDDIESPLAFGRSVIEYCEQHGLAAEAERVQFWCKHLSERERRQ